MARIYANENFPFPVVQELRSLGHDVLTTEEAGKAGQAETDEAVLQFACTENRILITLNRKHFIQLHSKNPHHPGIIVCSYDPDFQKQAKRIHAEINAYPIMTEKLLRINREG